MLNFHLCTGSVIILAPWIIVKNEMAQSILSIIPNSISYKSMRPRMLAAFQVPREALAVHPGERHRRQEGEAAADRRCRIVVVTARCTCKNME